jgi:hypothetical protein
MSGGVGFAFEVESWSLKTSKAMDDVLRDSVIEFVQRVIDRTPIDTSTRHDEVVARGDWNFAIGTDPEDVSRNDPSGERAMAGLRAIVALWRPTQSFGSFLKFWQAKGDANLFIANFKPYIRRLEYEGHSDQAPNGMLGVTVQEWADIIQEQAAKHGSA